MNNRIWIKALEKWKNSKQGDNGLTIPFLVGIQTEQEEAESYTAQDILEYIFDNKDAKERYAIVMCPKLLVPIIEKKGDSGYLDYFEGKWLGENIKVYVDDKIISNYGETPTELIASLSREFENYISENLFSRVKGEWMEYTSEDEDFIQSILNQNGE